MWRRPFMRAWDRWGAAHLNRPSARNSARMFLCCLLSFQSFAVSVWFQLGNFQRREREEKHFSFIITEEAFLRGLGFPVDVCFLWNWSHWTNSTGFTEIQWNKCNQDMTKAFLNSVLKSVTVTARRQQRNKLKSENKHRRVIVSQVKSGQVVSHQNIDFTPHLCSVHQTRISPHPVCCHSHKIYQFFVYVKPNTSWEEWNTWNERDERAVETRSRFNAFFIIQVRFYKPTDWIIYF